MNRRGEVIHPEFAGQVDAWLDGELPATDARELEAHLAQCPDCAGVRDDSLALRAALKARVPRLEAPPALRARVRAAVRASAAPRPRYRTRVVWRSLALAASLAVVAVGSWQVALRNAAGDAIADQVLESHIRSLM